MAKKLARYLAFLSDLVAVNLSLALIFWLRHHSGFFPGTFDPSRSFGHYSQPAFLLSLAWVGYFFFTGLYRDWFLHSRLAQVMLVSKEITFFCLLILAVTTGSDLLQAGREHRLLQAVTTSRFMLMLCYWLIFLVLVNGLRLLASTLIRNLLRHGIGQERFLILGATEAGERIHLEIESAPEMGWKAVGFVDESPALRGREFCGLPVLGKYAELPQLVPAHRIAGLIVSHESSSHNEILRVLSHVTEFPVSLFIVPDLYDAATGHFKTNAVHGIALKELFPEHMPAWEAELKRVIDLMSSTLGLVLLGPIMLAVGALVRWDSPGPALYSQERIGQYGRRFHLFKFRTMRIDAEALGPQWAGKNDPRVTRLGRFLRRSRLDELPQLWNILVGEMSLVGPRPEREHFISQLRHEVPLYLRRLKMKPGLTGWAQVKHHYDASLEDVKTKVLFDLWYFENMSLSLDLSILLRTIWVVLTGKGAH